MSALHSIRMLVRSILGLDFERHTPMTDPFLRLVDMLHRHEIDLVLDIGANDGGYASDLLSAGYRGRIVSFEPLLDVNARLASRARARSDRWSVAPAMALSDRAGATTFNVAGNSVSSSLLEMTDAHTKAAPNSSTVASVAVQTARLDEIWPTLASPPPRRAFLKVDTQGSEQMVLDGAGDLLGDAILGVQLEMSLTGLYKGQALAHELDARLRTSGYFLWDIIPGFRDAKNYRLMQYDGVYLSNSPDNKLDPQPIK